MNYNISLTNNSLTVVFTGGSGVRIHTINSSHPSWSKAIEHIGKCGDGESLEKMMSVKESIVRFTHGKIVVSDNEVLYDGKPIHNFVVDRILDFARNGLPYQPLVKFLERVRNNPSARSVEELYKFLEHRKMPLTPNGTFLAYKSVNADYTDHHTGTIRNKVGDSPTRLERNQVDDDANRGCSYGYHVGSLEFAQSFRRGDKHLMIVEVDPADVVSVPYDCNCQKLRCTWYKVIDEFKHVLDDNYTGEYHDESFDEDDTERDEWFDDEGDHDEENDLENVMHIIMDKGSEDGYSDALARDCRNPSRHDMPDDPELSDLYVRYYHRGYNVGLDYLQNKK